MASIAAALVMVGVFGLTACHPLPEQTALQMTLTDSASSDAPAANVNVWAFPAGDTTAPATTIAVTDASGTVWFTHDALPAGDYQIMFGSPAGIDGLERPVDESRWYDGSATGAATTRSGAETITVSAAGPLELTDSFAVPRGNLDGYLFDGGDRLEGFTVSLYAVPTGSVVATTTTDADGFYLFSDVPAQAYKVRYTKPGWTSIWGGEGNRTEYSFADAASYRAVEDTVYDGLYDHYPEPESTLTGTVTPDGTNPMGGVFVAAFVADTDQLAETTTTASDGTFTLHGLAGVDYHLAFYAPGGAVPAMVLGGGAGPEATLDPADGSAFSLQPGGTLSVGTVSMTVGADCAAAQAGATKLREADLHNCDLHDADLSHVGLRYANLAGANLSHAMLPESMFDPASPLGGATLVGANLVGANLSAAQASSGYTDMSGADLSGADLSHADMESAFLTGSDLVGANLSQTDLSYADIDESDVSGADLSSATFRYTTTGDLTWTTAPTIPAGYRLINQALIGAGTAFNGTDFSGADLSGMNLTDLWLTSVNLTGADLSNTTLTDTSWLEVNLSGADLSGADLSPDSSGYLTWDASTVLPDGWSIVNGSFQHD